MTYYTNKYIQTPETEKELKWKTINWSLAISVCSTVLLLAIALIIGGIYGLNNDNLPLAVYSFVMAATFLVLSLSLPLYIINHFKLPKTYLEIESKFNEDNIHISASNGITHVYDYHKLKKVKETKNFYILIFQETEDVSSYLAVKKETTEEAVGFVEFVKKKQKL